MDINPNAPHFVLAAVKRLYPDLPNLIGPDSWNDIQPQVDTYVAVLEAGPNEYLVSTQLVGLLAQYEPARQRLTTEINVQEVISQNIAEQMQNIAIALGFDPATTDGLSAAAYSHLTWEVDPETIPAPGETIKSRISMVEGGVGGAKSVKFRNMRLYLGDFAKIAAGFVTTGSDILDKPHPLLIAAGVLLTVCALHDVMKVEVSEQEASVFWGMTKVGKLKMTEDAILTATNIEREKYGLEPLKETQVRHSLAKLVQIKSIEQTGDRYWIVEDYKIED